MAVNSSLRLVWLHQGSRILQRFTTKEFKGVWRAKKSRISLSSDTALLQQIFTRCHSAVSTPYFGPLSILDAHLGHHYPVDPANSLSYGRIAASDQSHNKPSSGALCQADWTDAGTGE